MAKSRRWVATVPMPTTTVGSPPARRASSIEEAILFSSLMPEPSGIWRMRTTSPSPMLRTKSFCRSGNRDWITSVGTDSPFFRVRTTNTPRGTSAVTRSSLART